MWDAVAPVVVLCGDGRCDGRGCGCEAALPKQNSTRCGRTTSNTPAIRQACDMRRLRWRDAGAAARSPPAWESRNTGAQSIGAASGQRATSSPAKGGRPAGQPPLPLWRTIHDVVIRHGEVVCVCVVKREEITRDRHSRRFLFGSCDRRKAAKSRGVCARTRARVEPGHVHSHTHTPRTKIRRDAAEAADGARNPFHATPTAPVGLPGPALPTGRGRAGRRGAPPRLRPLKAMPEPQPFMYRKN